MRLGKLIVATLLAIGLASSAFAATKASSKVRNESVVDKNDKCVTCHLKENKSIVDQWDHSVHADSQVGCYTCHAADKKDPTGYEPGRVHKNNSISK